MIRRFLLAGTCILAMFALPSCDEGPEGPVDPYADAVVPEISISADSRFSADKTATVTLTLDQPTTVDVTVDLEAADVQPGEKEIYAFFRKKARIPAGETSVSFSVEADVDGYVSGNYQVAIRIAGASWGTIKSDDTIYISIEHYAVPIVSLYSEATFSEDGEAKLLVSLDVASNRDVTVDIVVSEGSELETTLSNSTVVIPAGETQVELVATAKVPEATGTYEVNFAIAGAENADVGMADASTIYKYLKLFKCEIDGDFSEWDDPDNAVSYLGEQMFYRAATTVKANADAEYLYVYFEFDDSNLSKKGIILDLLIDSDGDCGTGGYFDHGMYDPYDLGIEWLGEFNMFDGNRKFCNFRDVDIFEFNAGERADLYANLKQHHGDLDSFGTGVYDPATQTGRVEIKLSRTDFRMKGTSACLGVKILDANGWKTCGYLPQGECESMSSANPHKFVPLLRVSLPDYAI